MENIKICLLLETRRWGRLILAVLYGLIGRLSINITGRPCKIAREGETRSIMTGKVFFDTIPLEPYEVEVIE